MKIPFRFALKRFLSLSVLIILVTLHQPACARVEVIPPYSIAPELSNLNISYFAKQDKIKITLYVINHETFPVTCDTQYTSGPDKKHSLEQILAPEKAVAFGYDYSKDPSHISLGLKCVREGTDLAPVEPKRQGIKYYEDATTTDTL